jgi:hypothetical protein
MRDATDFRELAVKNQMSGKIGGGAQRSFHDLSFRIGDDQMLGLHLFVRDAAGLDHYEVFVAGDTADIAEGVKNQTPPNELEVRFEHLFAEMGKKHGAISE